MGTIILIRGLPGSGKSTLANKICGRFKIPDNLIDYVPKFIMKKVKDKWITNEICADDFFMVNGKYEFNRFKTGYAHNNCWLYTESLIKMVESSMFNKEPHSIKKQFNNEIIVHNVFSSRKMLKPYYELAEKYGWQVQEIICKGNFGNVHNVPDEVIQRMANRFEF